jgi:hypothetical protein
MKKFIGVTLIAALLLSGCAQNKVICGNEYKTYGFFDRQDKNPNITYQVSGWSVFWGIVWFESIIGPVYFWGFDLWEPVSSVDPNAAPGVVGHVVTGTDCPVGRV